MTEADEFSYLAEEAADFGIDAPATTVRRVTRPVDGARVDALVWGDEPARLGLLHGGGLNAHTWDAFAMAFGAPVVAVDLPGHGRSSWRDDADYRAETNAATVAPVLEELAPDAAALVGQSLGGLTAIALAAQAPALVRRLVIVDVSPGLKIGGGNQVRDFLAGPDSFASRDEIVDRAIAFGFGPSRRAVERGVFHNTRRREDGRYVFRHHLANLGPDVTAVPFDTDFTPLWPAVEGAGVPVLLVRATGGFLDDATVDEFLARVPESRAVVIESGHNVQENAPVELARAVGAFVGE